MLVSFYWPLIIWKYHNQAIQAQTAGLLVGLLVEESPSLYSGNKPFCFNADGCPSPSLLLLQVSSYYKEFFLPTIANCSLIEACSIIGILSKTLMRIDAIHNLLHYFGCLWSVGQQFFFISCLTMKFHKPKTSGMYVWCSYWIYRIRKIWIEKWGLLWEDLEDCGAKSPDIMASGQ